MAISKITLNGVVQIDLTADTVTAQTLLDDYVAHGNDGNTVTGELVMPTARTASDVTVSGATVTIPAGAYSSQVQKSVASGTAGTPTATKGTVSNHAVTVTPSVTNSTGYITGGTKTGTGVSVSASELVSGTLSITSSGTKDVTNYASASVSAGTEGTPTATKGTVSNHSVSVTPSVTNSAGYILGSTKTGTAVTVTASELASGNKSITQNGDNIDVVGYSTVSVDVQSGGGSDYTYIGSTEFTVSTSSTTAIEVGTFQTGNTSIWTSSKMVYIKIRDKAGIRASHLYGGDYFIFNTSPGNGMTATSAYLFFGTMYIRNTANLVPYPMQRTSGLPQGYGVYPYTINSDGDIKIYARYSTSSSNPTQTIDGTFVVEVYTLKYPNDITPFDDDYS